MHITKSTLVHRRRRRSLHTIVNLLGQGILAVATALLILRVGAWLFPGLMGSGTAVGSLYSGALSGWSLGPLALNYAWVVDICLAGVLGVGLYFWFSGRTWCRFACPLAALMHIYARFSRFRIFAQKERCISCNVCTSVCHQGIDVMAFASRGLDMEGYLDLLEAAADGPLCRTDAARRLEALGAAPPRPRVHQHRENVVGEVVECEMVVKKL